MLVHPSCILLSGQLHCGLKLLDLSQSGYSREALEQLPTNQEEEKSCRGLQAEKRRGSGKGGTGSGGRVSKRSCHSGCPRHDEPGVHFDFFSMAMNSAALSRGTGLANTNIRNVHSSAGMISTGTATVGTVRQQKEANSVTERLSTDQCLGLGDKEEKQNFCVNSGSLGEEFGNTIHESDGASSPGDQYCYINDPKCHFMKRVYAAWLSAIQNATDTVFCQYLKKSEDLEEALNRSVEARVD